VEEIVQPSGKYFLWPKFGGIAAWKAGGQRFFPFVTERVISALTKSQLALMILSKLEIVAFAKG